MSSGEKVIAAKFDLKQSWLKRCPQFNVYGTIMHWKEVRRLFTKLQLADLSRIFAAKASKVNDTLRSCEKIYRWNDGQLF